MTTADVVIIGGGVIGTATAFHLASRGVKRVVLCERNWLAAGASGKSGALVRMHYANEPEARLAHASLPYFREWSERVGVGSSGFVNAGMVRLVDAASADKLRANVEMLERIGVNTSIVGPAELKEIAPSWRVDDVTIAAYEPDSGWADPVATTHGFAERARQLGAEVRIHTNVTGVTHANGKVTGVETDAGPISAPVVIVAGGAWTIPMLEELGVGLALQPIRVQVALFRRPPEAGGIHPICIDGIEELWLRPEGPDWASTLVGVAGRRAPIDNPDECNEGVDGPYVPKAREGLAKRMPAMADAPMRGGWAGVVTATADGKAVIDRHAEIDGLFYFTGDNGSSFKTAPAIGQALSEWVIDGYPSVIDPRPFRASRFRENDPLVGEHEYGDRDYDYARAKVMLG